MEQKKFEYSEMNFDNSMKYSSYTNNLEINEQQTIMCAPIEECPQEKVCHRYLCYEVPHIMPCNTRIINHHIYKHTYTPCYTTCEENVCENVFGPKCCF